SNGAGKSTLARVLSGLESPGRGRVRRRPRRSRVMLIMQRPEEHFVERTVREEIQGYSRRGATPADVDAALGMAGLEAALADSPPRTLSNGQQRIVAIACGLATRPDLLLLDEPMAGLDAVAREHVMQSLRVLSQARQLAICVISHHPDDLLGWAQRLWVLAAGRLLYDGEFRRVPVAVLDHCMDATASSLFYALRSIEGAGYTLNPSVYDRLPPAEVARYLDEAVTS
ncbi:MAG: ATP-binding cassette domain-containing protein, partial [Ktedonobacterales bacterium]